MNDLQTITVRPPNWMPVILLAAVIIGGVFYVGGKKLETKDHTPTMITVTGEGKTAAAPDIAELSFGITVQRQATAKGAMDLLGKGMNSVLEAVKQAGVDQKDIRTEALSLNPAYDWNEGRQIMRGFDAGQSLRVKVRDLGTVSDVLAAATSAGANQAGGVSFTVDDPEKARAEAREKAIAQAEEKAEVLARQLGMHLGKLKGFSEGGGYAPPMPYGRGGAVSMDAAQTMEVMPTPLPAGEQEVNVQVTLTYELR